MAKTECSRENLKATLCSRHNSVLDFVNGLNSPLKSIFFFFASVIIVLPENLSVGFVNPVV